MPAMAFATVDPTGGTTPATTQYKFNDDLTKIVTSDGKTEVVGTIKVWTSNGTVKVVGDPLENGSITVPDISFEYYDLTDATFQINNKDVAASYDSLATSNVTSLKLKMPAGVTKEVSSNPDTVVVSLNTIRSHVGYAGTAWNWTYDVKMSVDGKEETSVSKGDAVKNVELTLDQTWNTTNNKKVTGAPAAATTTINANKPNAASAIFYYDEVSDTAQTLSTSASSNKVRYDGAEHTIVMKPLAGYDVLYTVFNKKTGHEDAVEGNVVKVKDVLAEDMTVTATVSDTATAGKTDKQTFTFKGVNASPAGKPSYQWAANTDMPYQIADNVEYDPYDYVVVKENTSGSTDAIKKADKAAAKANADLLKDFFKDYYGITATPNAVKNSGNTTVKFVVGDYSVKKAADVDAKYAQMLRNFNINPTSDSAVQNPGFGTLSDTQITLIPAEDFFEIEFVNSPTVKTYKVGKKAKGLKKAKSFTVKAKATNGDAVSYKLINAPEKIVINKTTGKITCKKGLKKGTYKIKVKAYVAKSYTWSGSTYPYETQSITIKVKK
jgi:hypothetical protein